MSRKLKPQLVKTVEYRKEAVTIQFFLDRNTHEFFAQVGEDEIRKPSLPELEAAVAVADKQPDTITWIPVLKIEVHLEPRKRTTGTFRGRAGAVWARSEDDVPDRFKETVKAELSYDVERCWLAYKAKKNEWIQADWEPNQIQVEGGSWHDHEYPAEDSDEQRYARSKLFHPILDAAEEDKKKKKPFEIPYTAKRSRYTDDSVVYIAYDQALWDAFIEMRERIRAMSDRLWILVSTEDGRGKLRSVVVAMLPPAPPAPPAVDEDGDLHPLRARGEETHA